jgi:hypothetical protein
MKKIIILFIFILPSIIYANNWYVSTSSSGNGSGDSWANKKTYTSFNWASVQPGDNVYLDGGVDSIVYNTNQYEINTHGTVASPITITKGIDAGHNGKAVFRNTSPDFLGMELSDMSNTIFYNLEWKGGTTATGETWMLDFSGSVTNVTFSYCTFILNYSCGVGTETSSTSDNVRFLHCNSYNNLDTHTNSSADQFWLGGANHKNWEFAYCNIINSNPKTGATVASAHRDLMQCESNWGRGGTFKIHHCFFDDRSAGAAGACIESEHLEGNWLIYNNIFKSNCTGANNTGFFGILSLTALQSASTTMTVYNNTFVAMTDMVRSASFYNWDNLNYKNNIFYSVPSEWWSLTVNGSTQNGNMSIDYNQYYNTGSIAIYGEGGGNYTWAQWQSAGHDVHSTWNSDTPDFININGLDGTNYALTIGSDGIDDGTSGVNSIVTDDYSGVLRPQGSAYDLGAFEYLNGSPNNINVKAKIFLQGPFNSGTSLMQTTINQNALLPNSQPYNIAPWNYNGNENLGTGPSSVMVDWVLVELRSSPTQIVARRAAILKNSGNLLETDGSAGVVFNNVNAGSYYIVIYHRNHLAIMSAAPIPLTSNSALYDFTTAMNKAYGQDPMIELVAGKFGMYGADGNADGTVNLVDREDVWQVQNGTMGYLKGDFNMDSGVTITDANQLWNISNGKITQVP